MAETDINALAKNAQEACRAFLDECEAAGLKVRITETYRSQKRQNELYEQGRTKPGNVVTWTKNSRHTSRRAWDICQNIKGREYSDISFFDRCGKIAEGLDIIWGGRWKTPDRPHFEVKKDWVMPENKEKEIIDMEELNALKESVERLSQQIDEVKNSLPRIYHYTQDVPEWGRGLVQRLLDEGVFAGAADDDLNLSEDMLRVLVIMDRAGALRLR